MNPKRAIPVILAAFCLTFLSCGDRCGPVVRYVVDGVATRIGVEFNNDYGNTEYFSSVRIPWVYEFRIKFRDEEYNGGRYVGEIFPAYISAQVTEGRSGWVSASIYVDGELVRTVKSNAADLRATVNAGVRL